MTDELAEGLYRQIEKIGTNAEEIIKDNIELRAVLGAVVDSFKDEPPEHPWAACIDLRLLEKAKLLAGKKV